VAHQREPATLSTGDSMKLEKERRNLPDDELVELAKSGVDVAYVELCARHQKMAFSVIFRILKNREDTEDAFQEAILKVYLNIKSFDGRSQFSTWLTRIAINTALMSIRKRAAFPTEPIDMMGIDEGRIRRAVVRSSPNPESQLTALQQSFQLRQAIDCLPPKLRDVVIIREFEEVPVAQIAAMKGISVAATKSRLMRGRAKLSIILKRSRLDAKVARLSYSK